MLRVTAGEWQGGLCPLSAMHRTVRAAAGPPLSSSRSPAPPALSGSNPGVSSPLSTPSSAASPVTRLCGSWWPRPRPR